MSATDRISVAVIKYKTIGEILSASDEKAR